MLPAAVIVFREVIEAALVVSLVMAAVKGVPGRNFWIACGVVGGIAGAALVAAFAGAISELLNGMGEEVFNATILFVAVAMLTWHVVWMGRHGREIAQHARALGGAVEAGSRPLSALAVVVGVAVLREGSEAVLFLYGIAAGTPGQAISMAIGGAVGIGTGVALGAAMYLGLLQIPARRLFAVTNGLIMLLAAAMASQGVRFLVEADWLPALGRDVWDTSWLLSDKSLPGKMLHALIGYTARPEGIQIAVYLATLAMILLLARRFGRLPAARAAAGEPARPAE